MSKEYKWIVFSLQGCTAKTNYYNCYNKKNNILLGQVRWYPPFGRYSFFTEDNIVFEETCLTDISDFLREINNEHKAKRSGG
ncbi:MAG TPA: hypothetical protein VD996_02575 [Chitinophagaceae bacterium]|nr:hypothetical protein [Chitinophagaceae bacterium]